MGEVIGFNLSEGAEPTDFGSKETEQPEFFLELSDLMNELKNISGTQLSAEELEKSFFGQFPKPYRSLNDVKVSKIEINDRDEIVFKCRLKNSKKESFRKFAVKFYPAKLGVEGRNVLVPKWFSVPYKDDGYV